MEAAHLRDAQFLAGLDVVLDDAFPGAELDDFTLHVASITIYYHMNHPLSLSLGYDTRDGL